MDTPSATDHCFLSYLKTPSYFFFFLNYILSKVHSFLTNHAYIHTHILTHITITMKLFTASVLFGLASLVWTEDVSDINDYFYGLDATDIAPSSCTSAV